MASANDLITQALQLLGVLDASESPPPEMGSLGLTVLNQWIDALGTQRQSIYYVVRTQHTLTASTASYTIGTGGTINIVRPVWIDHAGLILDTGASPQYEIPITVLTDQQYQRWSPKALASSLSYGVYYDHDWTSGLGKVYPLPIPSVSTTALVLYTPEAVTKFADLSTDYTFPPGYERGIVTNLAAELAIYFPSSRPDPRIAVMARQAHADVKRANLRLSTVAVDPSVVGRRGSTMRQSQFLVGR